MVTTTNRTIRRALVSVFHKEGIEVIAEAFSAVLAGWWLWTKTPELCPRRGQWRVDRSLLGRTLQYGGVSALQQAVQPIGKVLIQGQVNALGVEVIAVSPNRALPRAIPPTMPRTAARAGSPALDADLPWALGTKPRIGC